MPFLVNSCRFVEPLKYLLLGQDSLIKRYGTLHLGICYNQFKTPSGNSLDGPSQLRQTTFIHEVGLGFYFDNDRLMGTTCD